MDPLPLLSAIRSAYDDVLLAQCYARCFTRQCSTLQQRCSSLLSPLSAVEQRESSRDAYTAVDMDLPSQLGRLLSQMQQAAKLIQRCQSSEPAASAGSADEDRPEQFAALREGLRDSAQAIGLAIEDSSLFSAQRDEDETEQDRITEGRSQQPRPSAHTSGAGFSAASAFSSSSSIAAPAGFESASSFSGGTRFSDEEPAAADADAVQQNQPDVGSFDSSDNNRLLDSIPVQPSSVPAPQPAPATVALDDVSLSLEGVEATPASAISAAQVAPGPSPPAPGNLSGQQRAVDRALAPSLSAGVIVTRLEVTSACAVEFSSIALWLQHTTSQDDALAWSLVDPLGKRLQPAAAPDHILPLSALRDVYVGSQRGPCARPELAALYPDNQCLSLEGVLANGKAATIHLVTTNTEQREAIVSEIEAKLSAAAVPIKEATAPAVVPARAVSSTSPAASRSSAASSRPSHLPPLPVVSAVRSSVGGFHDDGKNPFDSFPPYHIWHAQDVHACALDAIKQEMWVIRSAIFVQVLDTSPLTPELPVKRKWRPAGITGLQALTLDKQHGLAYVLGTPESVPGQLDAGSLILVHDASSDRELRRFSVPVTSCTLAVDARSGNVFVGGARGVQMYSAEGRVLGCHGTPKLGPAQPASPLGELMLLNVMALVVDDQSSRLFVGDHLQVAVMSSETLQVLYVLASADGVDKRVPLSGMWRHVTQLLLYTASNSRRVLVSSSAAGILYTSLEGRLLASAPTETDELVSPRPYRRGRREPQLACDVDDPQGRMWQMVEKASDTKGCCSVQ